MRQLLLYFIFIFAQNIFALESHIVVEAYSGKILSASKATKKRPVASLTKIATAIVALDWAHSTNTEISNELLTVPNLPPALLGSTTIGLKPGDRLSLRDALYGSLLASDNTAALAISHHVGKRILQQRGKTGDSQSTFVKEMNRFAKSIDANRTKFRNSHGLALEPKPGVSTAADMARISIHAMRRNAINFIVRQPNREIVVNGKKRKINNTNKLIGEPGIMGIKTGATRASGPCLATCMDLQPLVRQKADGSKGATPRRLIVVVLNSTDRFKRTRQLIRDGWAHYDAWLAKGAPVIKPKREILSTGFKK